MICEFDDGSSQSHESSGDLCIHLPWNTLVTHVHTERDLLSRDSIEQRQHLQHYCLYIAMLATS